MKNGIETIIESFVYENRTHFDKDMTIAEFLILDAESRDINDGWLWFLEDDEKDSFFESTESMERFICEIKEFLLENYNYVSDFEDL